MIVRAVTLDGPAYKGGLNAGDEILAINGSPAITVRGVTAKTWHHAALASNGKVTTVWIDGKPAANTAHAPSKLASIRVGAGFEGKIDEVAVYARYLPNKFSK